MTGLIKKEGGKLLVTSNDVADKFGKEHRTIYRKIEELIKKSTLFRCRQFWGYHLHHRAKQDPQVLQHDSRRFLHDCDVANRSRG